MRPTSIIKTCLLLIAVLVALCLFATYKALDYRNKYTAALGNPTVKIERHNAVVYGKFDPDRSQAYTCTTQKPGSDHIGMVCNSPDDNVSINCTVSVNPSEYFC